MNQERLQSGPSHQKVEILLAAAKNMKTFVEILERSGLDLSLFGIDSNDAPGDLVLSFSKGRRKGAYPLLEVEIFFSGVEQEVEIQGGAPENFLNYMKAKEVYFRLEPFEKSGGIQELENALQETKRFMEIATPETTWYG